MVNFSNSERLDMVMLYGVREHLYQSYSIAEIMVPSSLIFTIVVVIGPKKYCKLKNKFWNASKKGPTSAPPDLQLKLEFHSL
ncbi:hypothetical protein Zmor_018352 [Zophobas morio]|uniref:Uncharacterized protein n=1 Tax=Zophobas morio TaxID=2755281 RepID=A0AA38I9R3_9CUCU|nr:hypothetical protein Zmor_018352 [Zophobas morio]